MAYQKILDSAEIVRQYIEAKKDFLYTNKKHMESSLQAVKTSGNHKINCVQGIYWALRMTNDLPVPYWFYCYKGKIVWGKGAKEVMKKNNWKILSIAKGKTVAQAIQQNLLEPGDIIGYMNIGHTNLYAGNNKWYDFGHAYSGTNGELVPITKVYGKTYYSDQKISYIIRKSITNYRVQVGAFTTTKALKEIENKILKDTGYSCFSEKQDDYTRLYCGSFEAKENAEKRVQELNSKGFSAFII